MNVGNTLAAAFRRVPHPLGWVRRNIEMMILGLTIPLVGCAAPPAGVPAIVEGTAERYLAAWQKGDWVEVYKMEGRTPDQPSALHDALTDSLVFHTINEVRYSESAAACAVTLHWQISGRLRTEAGELYLARVGPDWRITSFRGF